MAADLAPLREPLTAVPGAYADSIVERLEAVERAAEKEDYSLAAQLSAELSRDGVHDIRPISYWLFQTFRDDGFDGIAKSLEVLENLLGASLPALGPERRKDEYVARRLVWLFDKITTAIEYHEKYATAQWDSMRRSLDAPTLARIAAAGERLGPALASRSDASRALSQLLGRARSYRIELPKGAEPAPESPSSASTSHASASLPPQPSTTTPDRVGLMRMELAVAPPFVVLCQRLKAFESLIERQDLRKAAVVAADIAETLEHFDPLAHFPELFARHAALLCKFAARLSEFEAERQSPTWLALVRHARVDLDGFVES
ncbi:MAG: type VI secretion system protein IglI family protein [Myxococcota bacterium]